MKECNIFKPRQLLPQAVLSACLLALTSLPTIAQVGFRPGYVVRSPGDTLRGEIEFDSYAFNAVHCRFRLARGGAVEEFHPARGRSYVVDGRRYETHLVGPIIGRDGVPLTNDPPRPVFLEVLAGGPVTVYYLEEPDGHERFLLSDAAEPLPDLVLIRRTTVDAAGRTMLLEERPYQRKLALAFAPCPVVAATADRIQLTRRSLAAAVARFNACLSPLAVPVVRPRDEQVVWSVTAGQVLTDKLVWGEGPV